MNNKLFRLLVIVMFLFIILINAFFVFSISKINRKKTYLQNTIEYNDAMIKKQISDFLSEYKLTNKKVPDNLVFTDINGITKTTRTVFQKSPKLVFYYFQVDCHKCVEEEINNLDAFIGEIGFDNIIVFTTNNIAKMKWIEYCRMKMVHIDIFMVSQENFFSLTKDEKQPFCFLVNDLTSSNVCYLLSKSEEYIKQYFKNIKSQFKK